jgi:hypothetical protein
MSSFTIPELSSDPFISVPCMASRAMCSPQAVYAFIRTRRLPAIRVAGRWLIPESAATAFIETWPTKNRGAANRWAEYRAWAREQAA